jgi:hypothetical protein
MAPRKGRTGRKGAAGKSAAKSSRKHRKRVAATKPTAGIGHNKPPEGPVPHATPPNISNWHVADESAAIIVRQTAARQLAFRAATSSGPIAPPRVLSSDPWHLHGEMRKRIAALEKTIANLPTDLGPLDQNEIEELKKEIARLKAAVRPGLVFDLRDRSGFARRAEPGQMLPLPMLEFMARLTGALFPARPIPRAAGAATRMAGMPRSIFESLSI